MLGTLKEDFYDGDVFSRLTSADMPGGGCEFVECVFESCDFDGADFSGFVFDNCVFRECNLSLVKLSGTKLMKVSFAESKVEGLKFNECDDFVLEIGFDGCMVRNCNFSDLNLKGCKFENSSILDSDFFRAVLSEASFIGTALEGSVFSGCDMRKADFTDARGYDINPSDNNVKKARFSSPEVIALLRHLDIIIR